MDESYSYETDDSPTNPDMHEALGQSDAFLDFQERISRAAPVNRPVLIIGERGTGKELVARALHAESHIPHARTKPLAHQTLSI